MPLSPPPVIQTNLCLITQRLIRSDMSRAALLTFATECTGTPSGTLAQTSVNAFQTAFNAHPATIIDNEVTIDFPTIRLGAGTTVPYEAVANGSSITGGASSTTVPPNVALLVKKVTALGGKQNRGRTYYPFLIDSSLISEAGVIQTSALNTWQGVMNAFLTALSSANIPMCIANKVFNVPLPPHHVTSINTGPLVTGLVVESIAATQRRRIRS